MNPSALGPSLWLSPMKISHSLGRVQWGRVIHLILPKRDRLFPWLKRWAKDLSFDGAQGSRVILLFVLKRDRLFPWLSLREDGHFNNPNTREMVSFHWSWPRDECHPLIVPREDGLFPLWILREKGHSLSLALRRKVIFFAMSKGEGSFIWLCLKEKGHSFGRA